MRFLTIHHLIALLSETDSIQLQTDIRLIAGSGNIYSRF